MEHLELVFKKERKLIILIGHNNSGKTSILEAVKFFFSDETKGDDLWPLNSDGGYKELGKEEVFIQAEIQYEEDEIENIKEQLESTKQDRKIEDFLKDNSLTVRKKIRETKRKIQATEYEFQNQEGSFENITGYIPNTGRILPRFIYLSSIANIEDCQTASQRAQHTFEELFELYFEGLRWSEDEDIKNSVQQLILEINNKLQIQIVNKKFKDYLTSDVDLGISDIEIQQGFVGVENLSNLIKKVKITIDDGVKTEAIYKGTGTQRVVIFTLLKLIAEQRKNEQARETIFLIDEPDLHLHPQLQKEMRLVLEKLSEKLHAIVSTHSHLMIGRSVPKLFTIKKIYRKDNIVRDENLINEEKLFRELFTYLGYVPSDFLLPDNIVLVEGKFDKQFLDKVADLMREGREIEESYNVSIIDIGGDGQIKKALKFIQDLPSAISFFQGLPAYQGRFCGLFDSSKKRSLIDWREKANDKSKPYRMNCLDKNGIEYYYPKSLLDTIKKKPDDLVKDDEEKLKAADYVNKNMTKEHLKEIDNKIKDLIKLAFEKAKIL